MKTLALTTACLTGLLLAGAAQAASDPAAKDPRVEAMDAYFQAPASPQTYRALSGMGDPKVDTVSIERYSRYDWPEADKPLVAALFSDEGQSRRYGAGSCRPEQALATAHARIASLGADHPYVRHWLRVQRAVFSACFSDAADAAQVLPPPLEIADPALAQLQLQDRAYQSASLKFYRGEREAALTAFSAIADSRSPHRAVALYMVVAIKAGTDAHGSEDHTPMVPSSETVAALHRILADPNLQEIHARSAEMLGWLAWNTSDKVARRGQVGEILSALELPSDRLRSDPIAQTRYARALDDEHWMHRNVRGPDWWVGRRRPGPQSGRGAMAEASDYDPLAVWLLIDRPPTHTRPWLSLSPLPKGWNHVRAVVAKRFGAKTRKASSPWSHESLALGVRYDASRWRWIEAETARVRRSPEDQRALAALPLDFYHQVRTALMDATPAQRPSRLKLVIARMRAFPYKSSQAYGSLAHDALQYLIATGDLRGARRFRDALGLEHFDRAGADFQIRPLLVTLAESQDRLATMMKQDGYLPWPEFNALSIDALWSLAGRTDLPAAQRAAFARTAWTRTYALGRSVSPAHDGLMRTLNPEITAGWRTQAGAAANPRAPKLAMDVLAAPAMNILITESTRVLGGGGYGDGASLTGIDHFEHSDQNWWCEWEPERHRDRLDAELSTLAFGGAFYGWFPDRKYSARLRLKLRPLQRSSYLLTHQGPAEQRALSRIDSGPKQLSERVIAWTQDPASAADGADQAEALARAVASTRWGCQRQGGHGVYSHAAFNLLRARFPTSDASKRTKYWFDCSHFSGGCPEKPAPTPVAVKADDSVPAAVGPEQPPVDPAVSAAAAAPAAVTVRPEDPAAEPAPRR
jgi:hypothetical protein